MSGVGTHNKNGGIILLSGEYVAKGGQREGYVIGSTIRKWCKNSGWDDGKGGTFLCGGALYGVKGKIMW